MGSAAGRRKCCAGFFMKGYDQGFEEGGDPPNKDVAMWNAYAGTVSRTFVGLFRIGWTRGVADKSNGKKDRFAYDTYRCEKDGREPVLPWMEQGFTLAYAPDVDPKHPFTLTSPDGKIELRRSRSDVYAVSEEWPHRNTICKVLREAQP